MSSTGFLYLNMAFFRFPRRRSRRRWSNLFTSLHCAIDEETGTVRAFDLPVVPEIEKDPGVTQRPAAAIAGGDRLINVDGFERPHVRSELHSGRLDARCVDCRTQ